MWKKTCILAHIHPESSFKALTSSEKGLAGSKFLRPYTCFVQPVVEERKSPPHYKLPVLRGPIHV